jgi:hypothetical protein
MRSSGFPQPPALSTRGSNIKQDITDITMLSQLHCPSLSVAAKESSIPEILLVNSGVLTPNLKFLIVLTLSFTGFCDWHILDFLTALILYWCLYVKCSITDIIHVFKFHYSPLTIASEIS